jgi:hypothetical protein
VHPPLGLSARRVLVLDPASPRFEAVPAYAPDSSTVRVERRARLGVDGRVDVIESMEVTGYYGSSLRSRLKSLEAAKHKDWAQQELAHWLSGSELASFEAREVGDADKPLVLELKYTLPVGCTPEQQSWRCTPGLTWEREYLEVDPVASRRTPFTIEYPLRLSSRTTLEAPAGWALEPAAGAAARSDDAFAAWSTQVVRSGGAVVVTFEATLKRGEFPAERYAAFRGLLDSALRSIRSAVRADPPRQGVLAAP